MQSQDFNQRLLLQRPTLVQDLASGAMVTFWVDVGRVWASVDPLSARDFIAAQAVQSEVSVRIVIRYRAGVDQTMRLLGADGVVYAIKGVLPDKVTGREFITLPCSQGVLDG